MERQMNTVTLNPTPTFIGKGLVGLVAAVLLTLTVPHAGQAAPGDLDPSFGTGGDERRRDIEDSDR